MNLVVHFSISGAALHAKRSLPKTLSREKKIKMRSSLGKLRNCSTRLSKDEILARHRTLDFIERSPEFAVDPSALASATPNYYLQNHPDPETALRIQTQMNEIAVMIEKMNAREQAGNKVIIMAASLFLSSSLAYSLYQFTDVNTIFSSSLPSPFTVLRFSTARRLLSRMAQLDLLPVDFGSEDPYMIRETSFSKNHPKSRPLKVSIPVGLASGIDVECLGPGAFLKLGFGSIEVGPVSIEPTDPIEENSVQLLSNSLVSHGRRCDGSAGLEAVGDRLASYIAKRDDDMLTRNTITGISIFADSPDAIDRIVNHKRLMDSADYVSLDVSRVSDSSRIVEVLQRLEAQVDKRESSAPIFLKVSLSQSLPPPQAVVDAVKASSCVVGVNVAGYALASGDNKQITTFTTAEDVHVSGVLVREKATQAVGEWFKALGCGKRGKMIIASGGVFSGKDALDKIEAGASFVNVFSAFVLDGAHIARRIKTQLSVQLMNKGYYNIEEAIGAAHKEKSKRLKEAARRRKLF